MSIDICILSNDATHAKANSLSYRENLILSQLLYDGLYERLHGARAHASVLDPQIKVLEHAGITDDR
jgi:hypothetical protein